MLETALPWAILSLRSPGDGIQTQAGGVYLTSDMLLNSWTFEIIWVYQFTSRPTRLVRDVFISLSWSLHHASAFLPRTARDRQGCHWSQICKCCRHPREIRRTNGSMWMLRSKLLQFLGQRWYGALGLHLEATLVELFRIEGEGFCLETCWNSLWIIAPNTLKYSNNLQDWWARTPHCLLFFSARFRVQSVPNRYRFLLQWIHSNWSELSQTFSDKISMSFVSLRIVIYETSNGRVIRCYKFVFCWSCAVIQLIIMTWCRRKRCRRCKQCGKRWSVAGARLRSWNTRWTPWAPWWKDLQQRFGRFAGADLADGLIWLGGMSFGSGGLYCRVHIYILTLECRSQASEYCTLIQLRPYAALGSSCPNGGLRPIHRLTLSGRKSSCAVLELWGPRTTTTIRPL